MYCVSEPYNETYLLGVEQVLEESLLVPGDTLVHVSGGVVEARDLTTLTADDTVQVGTDCTINNSTYPCWGHPSRWCGTERSAS